jgi:hypothetical protein
MLACALQHYTPTLNHCSREEEAYTKSYRDALFWLFRGEVVLRLLKQLPLAIQ